MRAHKMDLSAKTIINSALSLSRVFLNIGTCLKRSGSYVDAG